MVLNRLASITHRSHISFVPRVLQTIRLMLFALCKANHQASNIFNGILRFTFAVTSINPSPLVNNLYTQDIQCDRLAWHIRIGFWDHFCFAVRKRLRCIWRVPACECFGVKLPSLIWISIRGGINPVLTAPDPKCTESKNYWHEWHAGQPDVYNELV